MKIAILPGAGYALICFALLLAACDDAPSVAPVVTSAQHVNVVTETITPVDLTETFTLPARIQARDDLILSAEISGTIIQSYVREGMPVITGQKLLEIDSGQTRAQLEQEQQNVAVLSRRQERLQRLAEDQLVSRQELDNVDNALTAGRAALTRAEIQYNKSIVKSPIDGVIDRRHVDPGEYVDPGRPLLHLVSTDELEVIADVPEKDVIFLRTGQEVTIRQAVIQGVAAEPMTAVIEHIAFVADEGSRTYRTRMVIDQPVGAVRPGMIARAVFVRHNHQQVVAVPLSAVLDRRGDKVAYIVEEGHAREIRVTTGAAVDGQLIVRKGLRAGQQLVVKGQQMLIDGAAVNEGDSR
ncbi:MAG: efflux RND transporter periplasmic adaptor subunit [Pelovirga sp.]